jgi:hypothetical protein
MAKSGLIDFELIGKLDEAFRLVGEFMWTWASLEAELDRSVRRFLGLDSIDGYIATANISVRDKVSMTRTFVNTYSTQGTEWLADANRTINAIGDRSNDRNLIAHNQFSPAPNGGVSFFIVKAKGKFSLPEIVWSAAQFAEKRKQMGELGGSLKSIVASAAWGQKAAKPGAFMFHGNAFAQREPSAGLALLNRIASPPLPLLASQDCPPAGPGIKPRTRKAPRPKPKGAS